MTARASLTVSLALFGLLLPLAHAADRTASLYQMHEKLLSQDGKAIDLDVYRGQPVLVTMFYGSCPATCPLIIDTLRAVERKVDEPRRQQLRVLLVSLDAGRDTPVALRKVADERRIDTTRWTLAHADAAAVRRIAAALEHPVSAIAKRGVQSLHDHLGARCGRKDPGAKRGAGPRRSRGVERDQCALSGWEAMVMSLATS